MVDVARVELASLNLQEYTSTSLVYFFYSYDINIQLTVSIIHSNLRPPNTQWYSL